MGDIQFLQNSTEIIQKIHIHSYTDDITMESSEIFLNFSFALGKFLLYHNSMT